MLFLRTFLNPRTFKWETVIYALTRFLLLCSQFFDNIDICSLIFWPNVFQDDTYMFLKVPFSSFHTLAIQETLLAPLKIDLHPVRFRKRNRFDHLNSNMKCSWQILNCKMLVLYLVIFWNKSTDQLTYKPVQENQWEIGKIISVSKKDDFTQCSNNLK